MNKSWWPQIRKQQRYGHLPPITKTIKIRRTRHAGHSWRSRDELISDVLLWTPLHARAKAGQLARIYIQQLCADTGCCPEDLQDAMDDGRCGERGSDICADSVTLWWYTCRTPFPHKQSKSQQKFQINIKCILGDNTVIILRHEYNLIKYPLTQSIKYLNIKLKDPQNRAFN